MLINKLVNQIINNQIKIINLIMNSQIPIKEQFKINNNNKFKSQHTKDSIISVVKINNNQFKIQWVLVKIIHNNQISIIHWVLIIINYKINQAVPIQNLEFLLNSIIKNILFKPNNLP